ncbi:MAG: hypothetical protein E6J41_26260 [Chloroflexi bacterium]|nr:MAG: hypothetical protein E6J41_26260 [Chloroflexota bacterium]
MNAHVVRFGQEIEEARARLLYRVRRGQCPEVQAYLAMYGGIALMRDGMEAMDSEDSTDKGQVA